MPTCGLSAMFVDITPIHASLIQTDAVKTVHQAKTVHKINDFLFFVVNRHSSTFFSDTIQILHFFFLIYTVILLS